MRRPWLLLSRPAQTVTVVAVALTTWLASACVTEALPLLATLLVGGLVLVWNGPGVVLIPAVLDGAEPPTEAPPTDPSSAGTGPVPSATAPRVPRQRHPEDADTPVRG